PGVTNGTMRPIEWALSVASIGASSIGSDLGLKVLGIETSCDESAAAVYDGEAGLLSHCLHSQVRLHAAYGGVVPELASRDHVKKLLPLIDAALTQARVSPQQIDAVAYTSGPGLMGALLVGASVARS